MKRMLSYRRAIRRNEPRISQRQFYKLCLWASLLVSVSLAAIAVSARFHLAPIPDTVQAVQREGPVVLPELP